MNEFNPLQRVTDVLDLKFSIEKLYGAAFPSLVSMGAMKLDGLEDALVSQIEKGISTLDKGNLLGLSFRDVEGKSRQEKAVFGAFKDVKVIDTSRLEDAKSYLGTPIFMPITFKGGTYIVNNKGVFEEEGGFEDIRLPATTSVELRRNKTIEKSKPSGQTSTVKEIWSFDDWDITIRGIIMTEGERTMGDHPFIFPQKELAALYKYENVCDSIEVEGGLFAQNLLNIKRICIESVRFGQIQGKPNVIPFVFQCSSDERLEIVINY